MSLSFEVAVGVFLEVVSGIPEQIRAGGRADWGRKRKERRMTGR